MTAKKFKDLLVDFIKELFSASNEVSSKRLLAFYFALIVTFLMFFNYNYNYISASMILIAGLMGLTTIEKFGKK
jgi:hypothetical protein